MYRVAFLHFADDTAREQRSGWYVCDAAGRMIEGIGRFEHHGGAVRAASALANRRVLAG